MSLPNTYNKIVKAIPEWCNRSESDTGFTNQIPSFIALSEEYLARNCYFLGSQDLDKGRFTSKSSQIPKPADWLKTISLTLLRDDKNITPYLIERRPLEKVFELLPSPTDISSKFLQNKLYYSDFNYKKIQTSFYPDKDYSYNLFYYAKPSALSNDNQANVFTNFCPDILFYAVLSRAFMFVYNIEQYTFYDNLCKDLINNLIDLDLSRLIDRSSDITTRKIPKDI